MLAAQEAGPARGWDGVLSEQVGKTQVLSGGRACQAGRGKSQWAWHRRREGRPASASPLLFFLSQIWKKANSKSSDCTRWLAGAESAYLFLARGLVTPRLQLEINQGGKTYSVEVGKHCKSGPLAPAGSPAPCSLQPSTHPLRLPVSVQATVTKCHRLGGLLIRSVYFPKFWGLEVQEQGDGRYRVWRERSPWFINGGLLAAFSLGLKGQRASLGSLLQELGTPFMRAPPSWLNHRQRPLLLIPSLWGFGVQRLNFEGTQGFSREHWPPPWKGQPPSQLKRDHGGRIDVLEISKHRKSQLV